LGHSNLQESQLAKLIALQRRALAETMIKAKEGHDHRLGHSNLQESQLAKVDSDAKEGAG